MGVYERLRHLRTNVIKSTMIATFSMPDLVASQRKNLYTVRLPAFVIFPSFPVLPLSSADSERSEPPPNPRMPCEATFVRSITGLPFSLSLSPPRSWLRFGAALHTHNSR